MAKKSKEMPPKKAAHRWVRKTGTDIYVDRTIGGPGFEVEGPGTDDTERPELIMKNKFLGLLAELTESPLSGSVRNFLGTLEIQARGTDTPKDTRYHQLSGLLTIVGSVAKDPELSQLFTDSDFGDTVQ